MDNRSFKFIDLFAGIGGFHQAMKSLGGECVFASDIDADCRKTYKANYGIEPEGDITRIEASDIPAHDVLCAGFPCQAFSKAGNRLGFSDPTKGTLFFDVVRIMEYHRPKYALLENVRNLASHDHGNTWHVIHDRLKAIGYNLLPEPVIFSPHFIGIPQHRERVYIMCVRKDIGEIPPFYFDKSNLAKCCIDSILQKDEEVENISQLRLNHEQIQLINIWDEFVKGIKSLDKSQNELKKLPGFPVWTEYLVPDCCQNKSVKEMDFCESSMVCDGYVIPDWKANFIRKNNELYLENRSFIDSWKDQAKSCPLFFGAKAKLEWQAGMYKNPSVWDHILQFRPSGIRVKVGTYFPALVAITQTSILGSRKRELSLRECARLQSFPDTFQPDVIEAQAYKQFGNAVNVSLIKLFAMYMFGDKKIRKIFSEDSKQTLFQIDYSVLKNAIK